MCSAVNFVLRKKKYKNKINIINFYDMLGITAPSLEATLNSKSQDIDHSDTLEPPKSYWMLLTLPLGYFVAYGNIFCRNSISKKQNMGLKSGDRNHSLLHFSLKTLILKAIPSK